MSIFILLGCQEKLELTDYKEDELIVLESVNFEILKVSITDKMTPLFNEEYQLDEKYDNKTFIEIISNVSNTSDKDLSLYDLKFKADYGDNKNLKMTHLVENKSYEGFNNNSLLRTQETYRVHSFVEIEEIDEMIKDILVKFDKEHNFIIPLSINNDSIEQKTFSDTLSSEKLDITFNKMNIVNTMEPSNTSGDYWYVYFEDGSSILYFDITINNKTDEDISLEDAIYFSYHNEIFSEFIFAWKTEDQVKTSFIDIESIPANSHQNYRLIIPVDSLSAYPKSLNFVFNESPYVFIVE